MPKRRSGRLGAAALLVCLAVPVALAPIAPSAAKGPEVAYRFVSIPDFLNADLGDVRRRAGWDRGDGNSINRSYRRAIRVVLDEVEAENPDFVTVAGDLVEGHWGFDADRTGTFGPVETFQQQLRAIGSAGNLYYGQWKKRFARRDLKVYPLVGDHEIGDDLSSEPMNNRWPPGTFRHAAVPTFKDVWSRNFTTKWGRGHRFRLRPRGTRWDETAYAFRPDNESLIVMVDVFRRNRRGVRVTVSQGQLEWLERLLADAKRRHIDNVIVQGHVPVLGRVRGVSSGELRLKGGRHSGFWRALKRYNVDMYLCGEVHAVTAINRGVLQICHGGLIAFGGVNYMVVTVYENGRVELKIKDFERRSVDRSRRLWQTTLKRPPISITYKPDSSTAATGWYDKNTRIAGRTGLFKPYRP